jgi:beta-glucosidase
MYSRAEPQYAFGHGLSYTTFRFANLRASADRVAQDGSLSVAVDVTNTGTRPGDEVVQLYVRHPESKLERPLKQLRGFARVTLAPAETRTVSLPLAARDLAHWDTARQGWVVEPGPIELLVGRSSADADLTLRRVVTAGGVKARRGGSRMETRSATGPSR